MTIEEGIQLCEYNAKTNEILMKRYDDASGYTRSGNAEIRTTDAKMREKCAEEHRQLATWLRELKELREQRTGEWIPVSERLPEEYGDYLVTFIPSAGNLTTKVIIAHYSDLMGIAKPGFWIGDVGKSDFADITDQVVAYIPLPEPYKADKEGDAE